MHDVDRRGADVERRAGQIQRILAGARLEQSTVRHQLHRSVPMRADAAADRPERVGGKSFLRWCLFVGYAVPLRVWTAFIHVCTLLNHTTHAIRVRSVAQQSAYVDESCPHSRWDTVFGRGDRLWNEKLGVFK